MFLSKGGKEVSMSPSGLPPNCVERTKVTRPVHRGRDGGKTQEKSILDLGGILWFTSSRLQPDPKQFMKRGGGESENKT